MLPLILPPHLPAGNGFVADYLDADTLRDLGLDVASIERLLSGSYLTGHEGRAVVEVGQLVVEMERAHALLNGGGG